MLIETFVETPRYTGAVYRVSGWIRIGATQGRGRYDKSRRGIWLRPLRKDWKRTLMRAHALQHGHSRIRQRHPMFRPRLDILGSRFRPVTPWGLSGRYY